MTSREEITAKVQSILKTDDEKMVQSVATDVEFSGDPEIVLANEALIMRLGNKYQDRVEGIKRVQADNGTMCPICKLPMKPIKLTADKAAVWCSKHFVVFPVKSAT